MRITMSTKKGSLHKQEQEYCWDSDTEKSGKCCQIIAYEFRAPFWSNFVPLPVPKTVHLAADRDLILFRDTDLAVRSPHRLFWNMWNVQTCGEAKLETGFKKPFVFLVPSSREKTAKTEQNEVVVYLNPLDRVLLCDNLPEGTLGRPHLATRYPIHFSSKRVRSDLIFQQTSDSIFAAFDLTTKITSGPVSGTYMWCDW